MTPFKPSNIGQNAAYQVFRVSSDQALSTNPKLKAFDNYLMNSNTNTIFAGTGDNGTKPMVGGIGLAAAPAANWFPSTEVVGSAVGTGSLLKGSTGFCLLTSTAPGAGENFFFNIDYYIPSDVTTSSSLNHVMAVEYQYTGSTPSLSWHANSGTEAVPVWTSIISSKKGSSPISGQSELRPASAGEGFDGTNNFKLNIPSSGQEFVDEIWVRDID
jgi:hypothetical protein